MYFLAQCLGGGRPLAKEFPDLFRCARNQLAKVKNYMDRHEDHITWGPIFRRNLEDEASHLIRLLSHCPTL